MSVLSSHQKCKSPDTLPLVIQKKIYPLTSLRFFAAFRVVLHHTLPLAYPISLEASWFGRCLSLGVVSVSFFFVLSGYMLATVYLKGRRSLEPKRFWIARFARIYPLFVATLILDLPNLIVSRLAKYSLASVGVKTAITFVANLFMLQAWFLKLRGLGNPNWSLSVETLFYLMFPFIGIALWALSPRKAVATAIAAYLIGLALVYSLTRTALPVDVLKYNPLLHIHEFVCGILICKLQSAWSSSQTFNRRVRRYADVMVVGCAVLFALLVQFGGSIPLAVIHDGLLIPVFGCVIIALAAGAGVFASLLSWPALVVLGESSYALYLIHFPLWNLCRLTHLDKRPFAYPVFLVVLVGVSVLSFRYFESPVRKAIVNRFAERSKETLVTVA